MKILKRLKKQIKTNPEIEDGDGDDGGNSRDKYRNVQQDQWGVGMTVEIKKINKTSWMMMDNDHAFHLRDYY